MQPTTDQLLKMMEFLKRESFSIPHYNMPLPREADGENYRPEKIFTLSSTGRMSYTGWGYFKRGGKPNITVSGIALDDRWIDRAYLHLAEEVRNVVKKKVEKAIMNKVGDLILRFNGLSFIDLDAD